MKKILLGCGILVLLGLGSLGYVFWSIWPEIQAVNEQAKQAEVEIAELDRQFPFEAPDDRLDTERFAQALDLRLAIRRNLQGWSAEMESLGERIETEEIGVIDQLKHVLSALPKLITTVVPELRTRSMSWGEFSWHNRLMWAALETVDAGVSTDSTLAVLRGKYPELKGNYNAQRQPEAPSLSEVIGDFPPGMLDQARTIMATDVQRVDEGISNMDVEVIYLNLGNQLLAQQTGLDMKVRVHGDGDSATDGATDGDTEGR